MWAIHLRAGGGFLGGCRWRRGWTELRSPVAETVDGSRTTSRGRKLAAGLAARWKAARHPVPPRRTLTRPRRGSRMYRLQGCGTCSLVFHWMESVPRRRCSVTQTDGPLWLRKSRGIRRWWARRGAWGKSGFIVGALVITLLVVAGLQGAGTPKEGPNPVPTSTVTEMVTETATEEPSAPAAETATIPAPVESEPAVPPPPPPPTTSAPERVESEPVVPPPPPPPPSEPEPVPEETTGESVYYENCDAARAAGAAPLLLGQPGYRAELDRNKDGVACE
ncbi:excalibur calcium-binding domain-containing protein [Streptomyces gardneri]|uniref:excalibur calcium-binding domain-containing protein n=1 Tax=Streptomyces gardneri TaxID=66892 RepID=UPI0035D58B46